MLTPTLAILTPPSTPAGAKRMNLLCPAVPVPARLHIPLKASAIVFAVPCPLEGHRPDVTRVTGGIVRMDLSCCTPRRFHVLLRFDQVNVQRRCFWGGVGVGFAKGSQLKQHFWFLNFTVSFVSRPLVKKHNRSWSRAFRSTSALTTDNIIYRTLRLLRVPPIKV